jgi:hypothetical protein
LFQTRLRLDALALIAILEQRSLGSIASDALGRRNIGRHSEE